MYFTDDPVRDAQRYMEEQEREYDRVNHTAYCEKCGRPCGAEPHYNVFGMVACSKECARELLDEDDIDTLVDDWLDGQAVKAGDEATEW